MPYERQLKQNYKTLSICVEWIKSDVNLKFRLKVSSNVIYRRRFQGGEYQNCSMCLCHSNIQRITCKLDSVRHKDKKRKMVILTSYWSAKILYKRVLFPNVFNFVRHCEPIGLRWGQNCHFKTYTSVCLKCP